MMKKTNRPHFTSSLIQLWIVLLASLLYMSGAVKAADGSTTSNKSDADKVKDGEKKLLDLINNDTIQATVLYFDPQTKSDGTTTQGGLGIGYNINLKKKSDDNIIFSDTGDLAHPLFNFALDAKGNTAFNAENNPINYLETSLSGNVVWAKSSATMLDKKKRGCEDVKIGAPPPPDWQAPPGGCGYHTNGFYISSGLSASYESNQQLSQNQLAYAARAHLVLTPTTGGLLNELNVLDWPFRLTRLLTTKSMDADANAFPDIVLAYGRVDPKNDKERAQIEPSAKDYDRWEGGVNFRSSVGHLHVNAQDRELGFSASWRMWQEVGPSRAIQDAHLDRQIFRVYVLSLDGGWQISYASGKLPLDRSSDNVWSLGYNFTF